MKNKKTLVAIIAVLLIAVVGVTFAYFQSSTTFRNVFDTGYYRLVTDEIFESPDNWRPGDEIPKTITTTNEGTIPAAVRVSYTEQWFDLNDNDITSSIEEGSAIINFDNISDWILEDGYYYYKYILEPGQTTSSFIKSVTLNDEVGEVTCETEGLTQVCEARNPALGAKYVLTITKETIQADKFSEWHASGTLKEKTSIVVLSGTVGDLQPGDMVGIGETEDFFVLSSDNSENGKTVLFAEYGVLVSSYDESNPGYGLQSVDAGMYVDGGYPGSVPFSTTKYWMDGSNVTENYDPDNLLYLDTSPGSYNNLQVHKWKFINRYTREQQSPYVYDENSNIYQYISGPNGYVKRLISMGAPRATTGRLISYEEAVANQDLKVDGKSVIFHGQPYWLGSAFNHQSIWNASSSLSWSYTQNSLEHTESDLCLAVRPIIEVPTSSIE